MLETAHFLIRCLRYRWRTERIQLFTLKQLRLRDALALDIGANRGIYCYWLSGLVGEHGKVIAFEPQPELKAYLDRRRDHLGLRNIEIRSEALSNVSGIAKLSRKRIGDGSASLQFSRSGSAPELLDVPLICLDSLELPRLDFIKCDVEGHEFEVFVGASRTISKHRPVIQFEASPDEAGGTFELLRSLGYRGIMYLQDQYLPYSNPAATPHRKFGHAGHRDFLFYPPEAIGRIIPTELAAKFPPD